jgi:hypothetical protein
VIERSDTEEVDAFPVLAPEPGWQLPAPRSVAPVVQTAAVAAGGFVAGAAVLGLVHRRHSKRAALASARPPRRIGRAARRSKSVGEAVDVIATRSLLLDVHVLRAPFRSR